MEFKDWWKTKTLYNNQKYNILAKSHAREAWQASRENQQEYGKYEFCRDIGCVYAPPNGCKIDAPGCVRTAKEFHHWLKENGYRIVRD